MSTSSLKRKADDVPSSSPAGEPKKTKNTSITSFFGQPKVIPASSTIAGAGGKIPALGRKSFDKEAWVAKLTPEQKELLKLEIDTLDDSWLPYLADELTSKDFLGLKEFLKKEAGAGKKIFPPSAEVYSWSRHTPLSSVKVVILGQDPYHNLNQAHGLCFSVRPPVPAPPSLKNIYKALAKDYPDFKPPPNNSGLLTPWADRGVLLLNTALTVEAHKANSHSKTAWPKFTQKIIDIVVKERGNGVVFIAWGAFAQGRCKGISSTKHLILKGVHPSPLAPPGFVDCGHFKKPTIGWRSDTVRTV